MRSKPVDAPRSASDVRQRGVVVQARRRASSRSPSASASTSSADCWPKPGRPSMSPSTRSTFQRRTRLAQRTGDALERLHAAFGVDEGAGGLGERRDRQQHVGDVGGGVAERRHRDDQARAAERGARGGGVGGVELGLDVQQEQRLHRLRQHLAGVQAARARQRVDQLRADVVAGLAEVAAGGAGGVGDPLRQRQQRRGLRMLRGGVAQQHGLGARRLSSEAAMASACGVHSPANGAAAALRLGDAMRDVGQRARPSRSARPCSCVATGISQSSASALTLWISAPWRAAWRRRCANSG